MTAGAHFRAALDCIADVVLDDLQLALVCHRSDIDRIDGSFALLERTSFFHDEIYELAGNRLVNVAAFDRRARLAGVAERAPDGCARGVLEIGVFENDHRIFSTELENDGRQMFRGHFGHAFTSPHAAGEHDLVDAGVDECRAGGAVASDDLEQTVGQLSLFEYASDLQCGEWSKFARFDDYCIARHQRHHDFVERSGPREIPRRDDAGDAERPVDDARRAPHQAVLADVQLFGT